MFVQMVQHKQRPFVAEFVNHVPNRTVHVLRIYLLLQSYAYTCVLKSTAKLQKFPKVTKCFSEIRSKKVTLSSFFAFVGLKNKWGLSIADTTLVHVSKPRFGSKYSGVLRGSMCCKQHSKCYPKHFFTRTN